nr:hypothetical protein Iba_chr13bCG1790 [Ipomoea batatas]
MLFIAPGCSSRIPCLPTVSIDPDSNTCFSTASANSAAASPASYLFGIRAAPAWPPLPSKSTLILAGAAIAVTTPIVLPSSSRSGPCSMCSSINAE